MKSPYLYEPGIKVTNVDGDIRVRAESLDAALKWVQSSVSPVLKFYQRIQMIKAQGR